MRGRVSQGGSVLTWGEFSKERPDLAEGGRERFYQFGVGLGFLATIRPDGGPRVHPMCPVIRDGGLYAFITPGPKLRDLHRDGRYAMNSFPPVGSEDHFYITGLARLVTDESLRAAVDAQFWKERGKDEAPPEAAEAGQDFFEFLIERAMLTKTTGIGDWHPEHLIWRASPR